MTDDDALEFDFTPWTPAGADSLRAAAEHAAKALLAHAELVAGLTGEANTSAVFESADVLAVALKNVADAQFEFTGTTAPLGGIYQYFDEEEGDELEESAVVSGISVYQRRDFAVTDGGSVAQAGHDAYLRMHEGDTEQDAAAHTNHLGAALYQVAHESGSWDSLAELDGLRLTGGTAVVVRTDRVLGPNPDSWPGSPFAFAEDDVLFGESDVYAE